jgi:hypothetical protein
LLSPVSDLIKVSRCSSVTPARTRAFFKAVYSFVAFDCTKSATESSWDWGTLTSSSKTDTSIVILSTLSCVGYRISTWLHWGGLCETSYRLACHCVEVFVGHVDHRHAECDMRRSFGMMCCESKWLQTEDLEALARDTASRLQSLHREGVTQLLSSVGWISVSRCNL